jgi:hypothetical protein
MFAFAGADRFQHGNVAMLLAELAEEGSLGLSEDLQTAVEDLFHGVERGRVSASSVSYWITAV